MEIRVRKFESEGCEVGLRSRARVGSGFTGRIGARREGVVSEPPRLMGRSTVIRRVMRLCEEVAPTDASVVLTGPTGVGKEVVARTIHDLSHRSHKPFVAMNCAALPETLLESELFGHERGAFTGATGRKPGHFEMAEGGTLMLDEVGEMPPSMQAKLLRALEQRSFLRVGGVKLIHCDVRIIAATNRNLRGEMDSGRFRSDLYFRLNVFQIEVPRLRDRVEDLPMLVDHFVNEFSSKGGVSAPRIGDEAMAYLKRHTWPGNVRELKNVLERALILAHGSEIQPKDLPGELIQSVAGIGDPVPLLEGTTPSHSKIAATERAMILEALTASGWNKAAAARLLGITWDNLRYRIKKYKLVRPG